MVSAIINPPSILITRRDLHKVQLKTTKARGKSSNCNTKIFASSISLPALVFSSIYICSYNKTIAQSNTS